MMWVVAVIRGAAEAIALLFYGWAVFLWRNLADVTVNWAGVATGTVVLSLLTCTTHFFCRRWRRAATPLPEIPPRQWRFRWTLAAILVVFLMFATGYCAVGLARHIGWLLSSPEWIYIERVEGKWRDG